MIAPGRKRKSAARPAWLRNWLAFLWGPGRPFVLAALLLAALLGAWYAVWLTVRRRVLSSDQYVVGPRQVQITPPPDWIQRDIRVEVFHNVSLDRPLSIMDENLAERVANAFSLHPWVAEVVRVRKRHPARLEVELIYRRPVCMVEVRGDLLPVDVHGVLLPHAEDDFSPVEKSRYPRLVGIDAGPVGTEGEYWGDARVVGGAEVAAALREVWQELNLWKIVPSEPSAPGLAEEPTYTLVTRGGTRIFWGRAPGTDAPGDLPAAEKIVRLRNYAARHGTLEGDGRPQEIDVYNLRVSSRPKR